MPHFFSTSMQRQGRTFSSCCFVYCTVLLTLLVVSRSAWAAVEETGNEKVLISGLSAAPAGKNLGIVIHCNGKADFIPIELTKPPKIVIDIADAAIKPGAELTLSPESYGVGVASTVIKDVSPELVRVEFTLPKKNHFSTKWSENDLVLTLEGFFTEEQTSNEKKSDLSPATTGAGKQPTEDPSLPEPQEKGVDQKTIDKHLPDMSDVLSSVGGSSANLGESTENSGRKANIGIGDSETISVDFYKIDIHNVFRMLREITGKNIVIAEGVSGTLTLALTDVPWQFALDIILNLKDLAKMERGNTIVIYQKSKEFVWPQQDNAELSVIENEEITKEQKERGVTITGEENIPPEQLEAKKLIANGRAAEKKGDLETALRFYEKALGSWPENAKLANKISATYLAQLNQNAKAVFFAKKALKADKKNSAAALNAAIGYANMEEYRQAQQYFDQSVNTGKPSREALISYAAFSERQKQYDAALRLLEKLEDLYGQDLNSMVAQARIYDSLGDYGAARKEYKAILHAGFRVPPDLKKFILSKTGKN
ncbi:MAG: AMIN domain-containing protein [Candidatus Electrothrix sp. GW3-4]|uniref:AMIN domain-containing protein n=1 Tax=Candidatus Electrothrix sp. GW3-4 TaxID=3126740 RepID=UPI0030CB6D14